MITKSKDFVSMEDLVPLIREQLSAGQPVSFTPTGNSMLPMLRHGVDSVTLSPVPEKLHKYDLPLYRRENGQYIMHRIVAVSDTYTCMGDNQFVLEQGLAHGQMIGLVTAFTRNGKAYSVQHKGYQLYCRLWYHSRHFRYLFRRGVAYIRRHLT